MYSLAARFETLIKSRSPGPAAYLPGKYSGAQQPPAFSFGVKGGLSHGFMTPGMMMMMIIIIIIIIGIVIIGIIISHGSFLVIFNKN